MEQGWQPISTAPKDGTELLVWRNDCGVFIARWTAPVHFMTTRELEKYGDQDSEDEDWFGADFAQGCRLDGELSPTHWMPLPAPPEKPASDLPA